MSRYFESSYVNLEKYIGVARYLLIIFAICYAIIKLYACYKAYKDETRKKLFYNLSHVLMCLVGEFFFFIGYVYMITTYFTTFDFFAPTISAILTSMGATLFPMIIISFFSEQIDKIINKIKWKSYSKNHWKIR